VGGVGQAALDESGLAIIRVDAHRLAEWACHLTHRHGPPRQLRARGTPPWHAHACAHAPTRPCARPIPCDPHVATTPSLSCTSQSGAVSLPSPDIKAHQPQVGLPSSPSQVGLPSSHAGLPSPSHQPRVGIKGVGAEGVVTPVHPCAPLCTPVKQSTIIYGCLRWPHAATNGGHVLLQTSNLKTQNRSSRSPPGRSPPGRSPPGRSASDLSHLVSRRASYIHKGVRGVGWVRPAARQDPPSNITGFRGCEVPRPAARSSPWPSPRPPLSLGQVHLLPLEVGRDEVGGAGGGGADPVPPAGTADLPHYL
jgi:hypothetical protein